MKKIIFLFIIILSFPTSLWASDPIIGTWKVVSSPFPYFKITDTFREVEGDMIEFSSTSILDDGTSHSIKSTWPKEGGIVKHLSPGEFPEDQLYFEVLDESGQWYRYVMKNGRQVAMYNKTVSEDGKTLTMTFKGTSPGGEEIVNKIVYKRDDKDNLSREESINISKYDPTLPNILDTKVTPETDFWEGGTYTFTSTTDKEAEKVVLSLMGTDYQMDKSGDAWTASIKISHAGRINYSVAVYNETNTFGRPFSGSIRIKRLGNRYEKNDDGTLTDKLTGTRVERYVDNGDGTVMDRFAGLMMFKTPLGMKNYYDAEKEIYELNREKYMGYTDWRLPTASEWKNKIIDKSRTRSPALPAGNPFIKVKTFVYFWSKDDYKADGRKWVADLSRGKVVNESKREELFVWPVRKVDID